MVLIWKGKTLPPVFVLPFLAAHDPAVVF